MNKDRIIKLIEALKDHCRSKRCEECQFLSAAGQKWKCDINEFTELFKNCPCVWNIEKIKELL